ncbi:hypothetical protein D3C81_2244360 [compost metagenome]
MVVTTPLLPVSKTELGHLLAEFLAQTFALAGVERFPIFCVDDIGQEEFEPGVQGGDMLYRPFNNDFNGDDLALGI